MYRIMFNIIYAFLGNNSEVESCDSVCTELVLCDLQLLLLNTLFDRIQMEDIKQLIPSVLL